jgi:hypothetical protein
MPIMQRKEEAALWRSIDRLLDKLDKKKGKARLAKPDRRTIWSSWEGIQIDLTPISANGTARRTRAMSRRQLARMLAS